LGLFCNDLLFCGGNQHIYTAVGATVVIATELDVLFIHLPDAPARCDKGWPCRTELDQFICSDRFERHWLDAGRLDSQTKINRVRLRRLFILQDSVCTGRPTFLANASFGIGK